MTAPVDTPDQTVIPEGNYTITATPSEGTYTITTSSGDSATVAAVSAKQRQAAEGEGDTYPGTDKFPISTREQARNAVRLHASSDIPAEKVKAWLKRRLKAKGWDDLIPDSWKDSVTAAGAPTAPPAAWFRNPGLDGPTPLTVTDDGRVYGHLCLWDSEHIGFPGQRITPPRSMADYAYFHTGSRLVTDDDGTQKLIATGHITLDTGHASLEADARSAADHYDNTGALAADVCAHEDAYGTVLAGAEVPELDELRRHKLRACGLSGDWRRIGAGMELVAALSVPTPGFPVPRSRVASGQPVALVAAGALAPLVAPEFNTEAVAAAVVAALDTRTEHARLLAELTEDDPESWEERGELLASLLAEDDDVDALTAANWVEQTGTGHLPKYIKRISKHLRAKGMTESHAIAVAVNAAKRMCATGDVNFPGKQNVNAGSRAEACRAVAEWEAKKAQARAT